MTIGMSFAHLLAAFQSVGKASLSTFRASGVVLTAGLSQILSAWRNRRQLERLSNMDEHELRDIGLTRSDLVSASEARLSQDPTLALVATIGAVAVPVPLLLFQVAPRRTDELTVLICSSAQPLLSFLIAMPSPAYDWNMLTLFGVLIATLFVGLDVFAYRKSASRPGKGFDGAAPGLARLAVTRGPRSVS